jgi:hypothetical protein
MIRRFFIPIVEGHGEQKALPLLIRRIFMEETWFLAAAESLRGCAGLPVDLAPPADPERIRGAKEWLGKRMPHPYDPIIHQAAFTATFDLGQAMAVSSFARLVSILLA